MVLNPTENLNYTHFPIENPTRRESRNTVGKLPTFLCSVFHMTLESSQKNVAVFRKLVMWCDTGAECLVVDTLRPATGAVAHQSDGAARAGNWRDCRRGGRRNGRKLYKRKSGKYTEPGAESKKIYRPSHFP